MSLNYKSNRFVMPVLILLLLASCVPAWQVVTPEVVKVGNSTLRLPQTWLYLNQNGDSILASTDGPFIQTIHAGLESYDRAFITTEQFVSENTLLLEVMDYYIAEIQEFNSEVQYDVVSREAIRLSDTDAFKVTLEYKTQLGLRVRQQFVGLNHADGMYLLSYSAPVIHYFDKNLSDFNYVVSSFQLN